MLIDKGTGVVLISSNVPDYANSLNPIAGSGTQLIVSFSSNVEPPAGTQKITLNATLLRQCLHLLD